MTRRHTRPRAYAPDPDAPGRTCDMPGCAAQGEYRAPKSRGNLRDYWWFCLEHVRAYNSAWDFYKGMSPGEIEAQMRADVSWQRPSWPLGRLGSAAWQSIEQDKLGVLDSLRPEARRRLRNEAPAQLREPLATLGLSWPITLDEVKARYKELAKRHHPDANGGDRSAEERFKSINIAYSALRSALRHHAAPAPRPAAAAG
ncbi:MAG TPA: J domain-containing protein [Acidisphaera sp.]|nr:J domain-containing protein [Acidisphaera sp.]